MISIAISRKRKEQKHIKDIREKGRENAKRIEELCELTCVECGVEVDPDKGDIFYQDKWWCKKDWEIILGHAPEEIEKELRKTHE